MNTNEFDKLLDLTEETSADSEPAYSESEKRLHKKINIQMNKRIFKSIFLTLGSIALILLVSSKYFDLTFYDPLKLSPENEQTEDFPITDFNFLMDIYTGLTFPGISYLPSSEPAISKGFASYTVPVGLRDPFYPLNIDGRSNMSFTIKRGILAIDPASDHTLLSKTVYQFCKPAALKESQKEYIDSLLKVTEEKINEIRILPDSTILKVALSFPESLSMKDTLEFINRYPDSVFSWIPVDSEKMLILGTYDGIQLYTPIGYQLTEETEEKYPSLFPDWENLTPEALEECYLSRTRLIEDNPEFLRLTETFFGPYPGPAYREHSENHITRPEDVKAIGVYGYVKKDDLLAMIESGEIPYASIEDVKLSSFSKH